MLSDEVFYVVRGRGTKFQSFEVQLQTSLMIWNTMLFSDVGPHYFRFIVNIAVYQKTLGHLELFGDVDFASQLG